MIALILAAGFSKRMGKITKKIPKTLLKIGVNTILDILIKKLNNVESITTIYLLSNNFYYKNFLEWRKDYSGQKNLILLNNGINKSDEKKGFVGELLDFAQTHQDEDLLVVAADNLFDFELNPIVDFFYKKDEFVFGLFDIKDPKKLIGWETVELDKNKKIINISTANESSKSALTTFGLYLFPCNKIKKIIDFSKKEKNSDSAMKFITWLYLNNQVYGYSFSGKWYDVGSPEILNDARKAFS